MAQTTSQLTQQIEEQRSTLGYHLDELGDKVSPRRMTERRKAAVRDKVTSIKDRVMGTRFRCAAIRSDRHAAPKF